MIQAALFSLAALVASALAAPECRYLSDDGRTLAFSGGDKPRLEIGYAGGLSETCTWSVTRRASAPIAVLCPEQTGLKGTMRLAPGGVDFLTRHWTVKCPAAAQDAHPRD